MSGDVQPRKRKDKRRKKEGGSAGIVQEPLSAYKFKTESEDEKIFDSPDQGEKIHVQNEHGVGGNICVKIIFFCLLGLLVGAVGLIYLKSQGSSDVDLPTIEESRFADYFTGWLDDGTDEHEHDTNKNDLYYEHDEHDKHENDDLEDLAEEENEDHSAEEDLTYKLFGVQDNEVDVQKSNTNLNEVTESEEESETGGKVNGDESSEVDDDNDSDEIIEDKSDEEDNSVEFEVDGDEMDDISNESINNNIYDTSTMTEDNLSQEDENKLEDEEILEISKGKISGVRKLVNNENDDDDDDDIENNGSSNKEEESSENVSKEDDEEQVEHNANSKDDDDLGYKEIDISEYELDDELETEYNKEVKDESSEATEKLVTEENKEEFNNHGSEISEEEKEDVNVDTGGVAIKLGVGIALIIIAHLVLVQKWKSVTNAASDEKASVEIDTAKGKKEAENHSSAEPVISRRQTLVPESIFLDDEVDEEGMEDEDDEEEDFEGHEEEMYLEEYTKAKFKKLKSNWNIIKEPREPQKKDVITKFTENEELEMNDEEEEEGEEEEEEEEDEEENEKEDGEEDEDEDEDENEDEDEDEDEEDDYEEDENDDDDEVEENNDFRKKKELLQHVDKTSSQEDLKESTPIPPPRTHRDGRGAQDVDEDPIKHFEEFYDVEEAIQKLPKGNEATNNEHSGTENQKKPDKKQDEHNEWAYRQELEFGDEQFENNPKAAVEAYDRVLSKKPSLIRALIGRARALDHWAEKEKSNAYLKQAIDAYKTLLLNNGNLLDDETYLRLAERCIERMRFAGALISAIEVHKALIAKYPNTPKYRNMLAVTYLMMNKIPQARVLLNETLSMWPDNGFALAHYGFILKTSDDNMEEGAKKLMAGIQTKEEGVISGMFFFHLGDALHRLGRGGEAMEWYELGVKEGLFLSKYQRSLYNVNRLKGQPWWTKEDTTYQDFFKKLENNWREIRREGLELLNSKGINLFKEEAENLKDTGDWKQLDLYFRGKKTPSCSKAPVTCSLVSSFQPAATCTRGQIKFSVMLPNTHVWPHCGPTNCRLRSHLGLVVPKNTFIRVAEETRSWEEGKFIIFDDSFEHEVWHNGTGPRLVLIVDVWHPELTKQERRQLSPI